MDLVPLIGYLGTLLTGGVIGGLTATYVQRVNHKNSIDLEREKAANALAFEREKFQFELEQVSQREESERKERERAAHTERQHRLVDLYKETMEALGPGLAYLQIAETTGTQAIEEHFPDYKATLVESSRKVLALVVEWRTRGESEIASYLQQGATGMAFVVAGGEFTANTEVSNPGRAAGLCRLAQAYMNDIYEQPS